MRARRAANAARTDEQVARDRARLRLDGLKRCKSCRELLPLDAFSADRTCADGLRVDCRLCDHADLLRAAAPKIEELDLYACMYCGSPAEAVDHVIPRALGGTDDAVNLVPACKPCNSSTPPRSSIGSPAATRSSSPAWPRGRWKWSRET